ncbi:hypothetical protein POUND7_006865 [Theobroma cacao]
MSVDNARNGIVCVLESHECLHFCKYLSVSREGHLFETKHAFGCKNSEVTLLSLHYY